MKVIFHWRLGGPGGPERTSSVREGASLRRGESRTLSINPTGGSSSDYLEYVEIEFQKDLANTQRYYLEVN